MKVAGNNLNCATGYEAQVVEAITGVSAELYNLFMSVFTFLMVSSLFVGFAGFFQTYIGYVLMDLSPNIAICSASFLMTFSLYSLNKLTDIKEDGINMPERVSFLKGKEKLIMAYSAVAYIICMLIVYIDNHLSLLIVLFPLAANLAYGSRLLPGERRLKDIPVMKNLIVAISWALVTAMLPAQNATATGPIVAVVLYFMLAKAFINTALYDVRDVSGDRENGVRTIPVLIGSKATVLMLIAVNSTILPLLMFMEGRAVIVAAAMIAYSYVYILYFRKKRDSQIMDAFVDGEWMIFSALIMAASALFWA